MGTEIGRYHIRRRSVVCDDNLEKQLSILPGVFKSPVKRPCVITNMAGVDAFRRLEAKANLLRIRRNLRVSRLNVPFPLLFIKYNWAPKRIYRFKYDRFHR